MKNIVIFKNDRIGDLMHSLEAICFIISQNNEKTVHIFLSEFNYELKNLLTFNNTKIYKISNKLTFKDKFFLFYFFLRNKIFSVYILRPESFFFILPLVFLTKRILFNAICISNNLYQRPNKFLKKYLTNYVINDRGTRKIRKSILSLQNDLVKNLSYKYIPKELKINCKIKNFLPNNYIFFHFNKIKFNERGWGINELFQFVDSLKIHKKKIVISNDINDDETNQLLKKKYSYFENDKVNMICKDVFYLPNIKGADFFNSIKNSDLVIAFHGSITSIAAINNVSVLDIFHTNIQNKKDFFRYKNSFHEFKFKKDNYEFIIPSSNISKTIKKVNHLISNGRKFNNKII